MSYINNNKFSEIRTSANSGNEKAKMILQAILKGAPQQDLDNLVNDYYGTSVEQQQPEPQVIIESKESESENQPPIDLSTILDEDMQGLVDEIEPEDLTFGDFLKHKASDSLRSKKNADYFKNYDVNGRNSYLDNKVNSYNDKFNGRRGDIERAYRDNQKALGDYSNKVNYMLDDDIALNMDNATNAYNDFTNDEAAMKSFGRYWDEEDNLNIENVLKNLVSKYGKQNVIAMLNNLTSDNESYKNNRMNSIDNEIGRYKKSLESYLK